MTRRLVALVAIIVLAACSQADESGEAVTSRIDVFAASSLTDVFADLESGFETQRPEVDIRLNLAGSSALREQIREGAPADVFASASESVMAELVESGHIAGNPSVFARNRLAIAVPAGNPAEVTGLADFGRAELLIGLCAVGVPCGDFARDALHRAGVTPSLDTNEPDVRALLTKVASGELDAGIVYSTDVRVGGAEVEGIEISDDVNEMVPYPIAVTTEAARPSDAEAFVAYILSPDGQATIVRHGFEPA